MTPKRPPCPPLTVTPERRLRIENWKFRRIGMPPNPEGDKARAAYWAELFPRPEWIKEREKNSTP